MIEVIVTVLSTFLIEKIRPYFKRKPKSNKQAIRKMERDMPVFQTVGELRELLTNFGDDVIIEGSTFKYPMLQVRVVDNVGLINLGSSSSLD